MQTVARQNSASRHVQSDDFQRPRRTRSAPPFRVRGGRASQLSPHGDSTPPGHGQQQREAFSTHAGPAPCLLPRRR
eukprot:1712757-Pleurochrysis_carterae.AAC.1